MSIVLGHDVRRILQFLRRASLKQSRQWKVLFSNKDLVNRGYSLSMGEESSLRKQHLKVILPNTLFVSYK